jgi:branched-chain amino acid transport system permease protein
MNIAANLKKNLGWIVLLLAAVALPLPLQKQQYTMVLLMLILLYAVLATAWNIIGGMAGQLDLAAGAYLGAGAFTAGTLLLRFEISPWVGMFIGGLVAVALALVIGFPLFGFKVKEVWYALSSLALCEVLRVVFLMWDEVGGPTEVYLPTIQSVWYSMRFTTAMPFYYILLALLVVALVVNFRIRATKLGYQLLALGEDEDAAEVLGIDARWAKLKALMIYAFICGMVGAVYACFYGYLHPSFFDADIATEVAIFGIVGGMGIIYGPLLATILLVGARELLRAQLGGGLEGLYLVVYAIVLIVVALYQPRGIAPLVGSVLQKFRGAFNARKKETAGVNHG